MVTSPVSASTSQLLQVVKSLWKCGHITSFCLCFTVAAGAVGGGDAGAAAGGGDEGAGGGGGEAGDGEDGEGVPGGAGPVHGDGSP